MNAAILRRATGVLTGALLGALLLAASAGAASSPASAPRARGAIAFTGAFTVSHQTVTVPGRSVLFEGVVRPYAPGQHTTVRVYFGRRLLKVEKLSIRRSRGGTFGYFEDRVVSPDPGEVTIIALHSATRGL